MALSKTLIANGSRNHHKFTLNITEDRTEGNNSYLSYTFILSPIVKNYDWYGWGNKISYSISIGSNTYTGTIPSYNGTSTVTLKSGSNIEIEHNSDGTKTINISFSVSDTAAQSYTPGNASASDTFTLTTLHTAPSITDIDIEETNSTLTTLGIDDDVVVQFLSQKQITITSSFFDDATLSSCSVYHNNVLIGTSSSNVVLIDFSSLGELITIQSGGGEYVGLSIVVTDSLGGSTTQLATYEIIKYAKPTIENTSTTIKRKTGNGTVLTDNKVNLNFVGTAYKENDLIGNNNTPIINYKIWTTTEPSYTSVNPTISGNNVTITNYEISSIVYTDVYNYKIQIIDSFGNYAEKQDTIPTGTSLWTEYKDRVDFLKLQVNGQDVVTNISGLETELYYDQAGTNSTILLSDSAANYTYIEIFYYATNFYKSDKIYLPNGKKASLSVNSYYATGNDLYQYFYTKIIDISGTSITVEKNTELRILNNSVNNHTTNNNIYITRVVGIK